MPMKQQDNDTKKLEKYLIANIPITKAMGVRVDSISLEKAILSADFKCNINHKKTAFGGSLHAVATLACWSLLHTHLLEYRAEIVITKSSVDYLKPVTADFEAHAFMPSEQVWHRFLQVLESKGKAKIQVNAQIFQGGKNAVNFVGTFAAFSNTR